VEEEETTEDELRRVQLRRMEDNAMEVCAPALSPSRFIAVDPSFKVLRSGKNKARHSSVLRALQTRGGQGTNLSRRLGMAWRSTGPCCPRHDESKGLPPKPCQGQPADVSVDTPNGLAELTSTCPATHGGWVDG
jgi:hypothetical protein